MTAHDVKSDRYLFDSIHNRGVEIRLNDRNYSKGDHIRFREWDGLDYTGYYRTATIDYVYGVYPMLPGLMRGYVMLVLANISCIRVRGSGNELSELMKTKT
jgi:hypothetical protein